MDRDTRRDFLRTMLMGGVVSSFALPRAFADLGPSRPYKALVCVTLAGGLDSHDTLVPLDRSGYQDWSRARGALLDPLTTGNRERSAFLPLGSNASNFGFVPELSPLANLYRAGRLAVVANTGPLVEPATKRLIADGSVRIPPRLASHNDQRSIWHTNDVEGAPTGWGGRMLDQLADRSDLSAISVQVKSPFIVGDQSPGISVGAGPFKLPQFMRRTARGQNINPVERHLRGFAQEAESYFGADVISAQRRAIDAAVALQEAVGDTAAGDDAALKDNKLSKSLAMVAKLISVHKRLDLSHQVFAVKVGGFDTHRNQFDSLPALQKQVAEALAAFDRSLQRMGLADQVTTFTVSDFGRTLVSNASGTDHGWGGHQFVMGAAVTSGRVIGTIPPYTVGHELDWRRGAMIPQISIEQYASALGSWFGLDDEQLSAVFPNRGRFDRAVVQL